MIIRSVKLKNIRSYEEETVEFPEGTVLLAGDIGSGKSSILLAIEFALFGIMRGGLPGTSLLRHGKKEGSVELTFELDDKEVTVYRSLKRARGSVGQDTGYIITDGEKFEGTPVELKARIIDMIGYPSEMVSKSKSLIYRYTVYTPQEEMKQILLEGDEARLDTLRKIFDIDKYKRIKENAALLARELRSKKKVYKSRIEDLDDVKEKHDEKKKVLEEKEEEFARLGEELKELAEKTGKAKQRVERVEKEAEDRKEAEKQYELAKSKLASKKEALKDVEEQRTRLAEEVEELKEDLKGKDSEALEKVEDNIKKLEESVKDKQDKLNQVREKEAERNAQKKQAQEIKEKITDLDECPVCQQKVTEQHTADVLKEQDEKIAKCDAKLEKAAEIREKIREKIKRQEEKLTQYRKKEKQLAGLKERLKRLEEKKEKQDELEKKKDNVEEEIRGAKKKLEVIKKELEDSKDVAEKLEEAKEEYEEKRERLNAKKVKKAGVEKEVQALKESLEDLKKRVDNMEKAKQDLKKVKESLEWLDEYFVKVIDTMEKQVMLNIYNEFNEYFTEWFNTLLEDETINVRLDEQFAPVIIQDGYETTVDNLSGGERTSVALAYRLSLNKVINDYIGTIKTKDIIILDEPTDGFSSEQLDKVREVLYQLDIRQVILVSHEAKLESYVQDVIEVAKRNHVSHVM